MTLHVHAAGGARGNARSHRAVNPRLNAFMTLDSDAGRVTAREYNSMASRAALGLSMACRHRERQPPGADLRATWAAGSTPNTFRTWTRCRSFGCASWSGDSGQDQFPEFTVQGYTDNCVSDQREIRGVPS